MAVSNASHAFADRARHVFVQASTTTQQGIIADHPGLNTVSTRPRVSASVQPHIPMGVQAPAQVVQAPQAIPAVFAAPPTGVPAPVPQQGVFQQQLNQGLCTLCYLAHYVNTFYF